LFHECDFNVQLILEQGVPTGLSVDRDILWKYPEFKDLLLGIDPTSPC